MSSVAVVGAGQCGLLVACRLARNGLAVTVVERLPAPGGQEPEHPLIDRLAADAHRAGATMLLGTMAVAWSPGRLQTLGVDGARALPCRALVLAAGTRPLTRAEMGISGDRCAGVVPGSAAVHLITAGVLLGRSPAVVGGGQLAAHCCELLVRAGAERVSLIADEVITDLPDALSYVGWRAQEIHGGPRVHAMTIERGEERQAIATDAVILAAGRAPMHNVEGAVRPTPGVIGCYSRADPKRLEDAERTALQAASETMRAVLNYTSGDATVDLIKEAQDGDPLAGRKLSGAHHQGGHQGTPLGTGGIDGSVEI